MTADAAVAETHSAVVFFVGDRAYKLKKPVDLGFLDFRDRRAREAACRREVELNRRLCPDVYLGVADVHGPDGELRDHLVVMRRMPEERRLSTLLASNLDLTEDIDRIARVIATFHSRAAPAPDPCAVATAAAVTQLWCNTIGTLRTFATDTIDSEAIDAVEALAYRYLAGRTALFDARITEGRVRDGHGDLLADDIFCLQDGPRVLDCLEFDDRLRCGDVLLDAAFLAMDLERLVRGDLAARFLARWREYTDETHPESLADHYIAYRALVRAAVSCVRSSQGADESTCARQLLDLCARHLERGAVRLVLIGGAPGVGKSTTATSLGETLAWPVLRSDEVRKDLAGIPQSSRATAALGTDLYDEPHTTRTYEELLRRAQMLLEQGESVILDASWLDRRRRDAARRLAEDTSSDLVELHCTVHPDEAARRIERRHLRGVDPSDATPGIARLMAERADPWPEATDLDTGPAPDVVAAVAARLIDPTNAFRQQESRR